MARREERASRDYVSDEQRSQSGCIGGHRCHLYFLTGPKRSRLVRARGGAQASFPGMASRSMTDTSPRGRRFRLPSLVVTALVVGGPAYGQDRTVEIDRIFGWATPNGPGCVVAVSQHGTPVVNRAYGLADLERGVPLTSGSIFDAGSVVKQFVAAAVLLLVEEGRLSLTGDVRKYVPELPDYGHAITLDRLLTHTSGIRDWTGLAPLTGRNVDALTLTLRQRSLDFAPGEEWAYSNSGYVLLKEIVARTSGMSFADFVRKRLFEPLGMKTTTYLTDLRDVVENRALAYEKAGNGWKLDVLLGNDRGGGGALLSTASDLLIWNEALTSVRLGRFVTEKLQEPATLSNGRRLGYARGLFLDTNRGGRVVWHTGGAAGYKSLLSRFPEQGLSLAILCNAGESADRTVTAFARRIFDLFVPGTTAPAADARAPATSAGGRHVEGLDLKSRSGLFFSERTGDPLRLGVENGRLRIQGGPPLDTVSRDRFRNPRGALRFMSQDEFELRVVSPDEIELTSMEGKATRYRRGRPQAPTAADLQALAGRYDNEETRAVLQVAPGMHGLLVRLNDSTPFPFAPVDRDTFQLGGMIVRFRRDKDGKVVGLAYSNPVVRRIEFTRLGDRPGDP
jgi:CubicO group peptidase (beta-lactamase class C family)